MCRQTPPTASESDPQLGEFAPSAKRVYLTLKHAGPLTQKALVAETDLASRTVRSALSDLVAADFVSEEFYLPDLRQRKYVVRVES